MANQVDFKILPSDQFNVYSPQTRSDKIITYFTLLSKLRGDILAVGGEDDPNDIVSAFYTNTGGTQTLHLVKADGSEITASQAQQVISGTLNYVSKFTSSNDIGNSQIFDNGTNVGIGTTTMSHKLELGTGGVFADYFQLDTTYSNGFVVGAISWDSDNGTADVGLSGSLKLKIGQDDVWYVKNQTGSTITKGTAVYASGTLGASSRITIAPMIANGTIPARFFLGIVAETIANGADGYVLARGKIRQISTLAYNEGDVLWVSPTTAGALTATEPTAPNLKLPVAFVVYKASNGVLAVRATTGTKIADASDVDYTGAVDNSFLVYDSATGVWEDEAVGIFKTISVASQDSIVADSYTDTLTIAAGTGISLTTAASTDTLTITNSAPDQVVSLTGAGTTVITGTYPSFTITSNDEFDGTVTSVDLTAGTGISVSGGPITTSGSITVTNTAPDQVVALTGAGTTTITGTYPNFTISSDDQYDGTVTSVDLTAGTGISVSGGPITSSGSITVTNTAPDQTVALTAGTGISTSGTYPNFTITNSAPDQTVALTAGTGISVTGTYPNFTITNSSPSSGGTVTSVATTAPITGGTITTTGTIGITQAGAATDGYLSSTDWTTFNSKEPALTKGNLTEVTSAVLTITGGTNAVIGTGTTIQVAQASSTANGYLSSTDWTTFNGKQGALTFTAPLVNTSGTITITQSGAATDGYLSSADWTTFNGKQNAIILTTTGTSGAATLIGSTLNIPQYTDQFTGTVTSVNLTAGTGISVSGGPITTSGSITVTNTDTGSAQNIFKNISVSGQSDIVADTNNDTLTFAAGTGISLTTNASTDTLTITNTAVTTIASFAGIAGGRLTLTTSGSSYKALWTINPIKDSTVYTHSTSVNAGDIEVEEDGIYEIELGYSANNSNSGATSTVTARISINGTAQDPYSTVEIENAIIMSTSFSFIFSMSKDDIITTSFIPTYVGGSTGAMAIDANGTYITIKKIG